MIIKFGIYKTMYRERDVFFYMDSISQDYQEKDVECRKG